MSHSVVRPTVDISPSVMAASRDVNVDTRAERPSLPHFVDSDTHVGRFSPIVAAAPNSIDVDIHAAPSSLSLCVDSDTHIKRLYAATHEPLAPPTTPVIDLLSHENDVLSSTSSDTIFHRRPVSVRTGRHCAMLIHVHRCWVLVSVAPLGHQSIARQRAPRAEAICPDYITARRYRAATA